MLQVGPFEMTDTEESFWEIVKNFGYLVSEFHYEGGRLDIGRGRNECVSVSFFNRRTRKRITITENYDGSINRKFHLSGFLGRTRIDETGNGSSWKEFALHVKQHYSGIL